MNRHATYLQHCPSSFEAEATGPTAKPDVIPIQQTHTFWCLPLLFFPVPHSRGLVKGLAISTRREGMGKRFR